MAPSATRSSARVAAKPRPAVAAKKVVKPRPAVAAKKVAAKPRRKVAAKKVAFRPPAVPPAADLSVPGVGWTSGALHPSLYPYGRRGAADRYGNMRRWIGTGGEGWSRIGDGDPLDDVHQGSSGGGAVAARKNEVDEDGLTEAQSVKALIAQLCESFYHREWATGTGGGISIRTASNRVFVAPSGLMKENMTAEDMFELDMQGTVVQPPVTPGLRQSACTPLWYVVYGARPSAKAVIHTHSLHAVLATMLDTTETAPCLRLSHLEMLKGVGGHAYDDVLEVPIIDNRPNEGLLAAQLAKALVAYPKANACLVRRHGLYVWGDSWEQAKCQAEAFDYLFEAAVKMHSLGFDAGAPPRGGTYRTAELQPEPCAPHPTKREAPHAPTSAQELSTPAKKRPRPDPPATATNGFNAATDTDNKPDMALIPPPLVTTTTGRTVPLLPRDSQILLLDIEGCTTAISFVKDVLFPFVTREIDAHAKAISDADAQRHASALTKDADALHAPDQSAARRNVGEACLKIIARALPPREAVVALVRTMMKGDVKATGLKGLQGEMWRAGYDSGELRGHVYPDFKPMMDWCAAHNVRIAIYSSGSIGAQKLLFGNSDAGDLTPYFCGHFDTTSGPKVQAASYTAIARALGADPHCITFVSDAEAELVAAREAGVGHVIMSVREGNQPLTRVGGEFPRVDSLLQLCGV